MSKKMPPSSSNVYLVWKKWHLYAYWRTFPTCTLILFRNFVTLYVYSRLHVYWRPLDIHFQSSLFATLQISIDFLEIWHTSIFWMTGNFEFWRKRSGSTRFWCIHFTTLSETTKPWPLSNLSRNNQIGALNRLFLIASKRCHWDRFSSQMSTGPVDILQHTVLSAPSFGRNWKQPIR